MFRGSAYSMETDNEFNDNDSQLLEQSIKIGVFGVSNVGKSSIIRCIANQTFLPNIAPTKGHQFRFKKLRINRYVVNLHLWDGSGQKMHRFIEEGVLKDMDGLLLVFDLLDQNSLHQLEQMYYELNNFHRTTIPGVLVGNKSDFWNFKTSRPEDLIKIQEKIKQVNYMAEQFAKRTSMLYLKVSAKDNSFVTDSFIELIKESLRLRKRLRTSRSLGDEEFFQTQTNQPKKTQPFCGKFCHNCPQCIIF